MSQIKLYNTLNRAKEEFVPMNKGKVGLYSCGPTVYWYAHIGNLRAFLFADTLRRTLELNGLEVNHIMNITDVGHLVGDGNEGEDKLELGANREGKTAWEIAEFYTYAFMQDIERLNIEPATRYTKATDHIEEQIDMIKKLEENGFTYKTSDGIYFDTSKLEDYGRLGGQAAEEKESGARVDMGEKKNTTDFALWKFSPDGEKRHMEWGSPWGVGFPGWHIECSAMSTKYLGDQFDIHTGGVDHISVHHENEIAQTQGAFGTLQANFWLHSEFLCVDGGKMSKSLGNLFTLDNLQDKGFDPLAFRYFTLGAHYCTKLNFTWDALEAAQSALDRLRNMVRGWGKPGKASKDYEKKFLEFMNDNLDTPKALALVWQMIDDDSLDNRTKGATLLGFDKVLGLELESYVGHELELSDEIKGLVKMRDEARAAKDFEKSDKLRVELEEAGYDVLDHDDGTKLQERRDLGKNRET